MQAKFTQTDKAAKKLLKTEARALCFGFPGVKKDDFWGYSAGTGQNRLAVQLDKVRKEIEADYKMKGKSWKDIPDDEQDRIHCIEYSPTSKAAWYTFFSLAFFFVSLSLLMFVWQQAVQREDRRRFCQNWYQSSHEVICIQVVMSIC